MHYQNIATCSLVVALLLIVTYLVGLAWRPAPAEAQPKAAEVNRDMAMAFNVGVLTGLVNPGPTEIEKLRAMIARGELSAVQDQVSELGQAHIRVEMKRPFVDAKAVAP